MEYSVKNRLHFEDIMGIMKKFKKPTLHEVWENRGQFASTYENH